MLLYIALMSKLKDPRSFSLSDYKVWFSQTNELIKRQWLMILALGTLQMLAIYYIAYGIIPIVGLMESGSPTQEKFSFFTFVLASCFLNMRFFYTNLAQFADLISEKNSTSFLLLVMSRWKSLMLEFAYIGVTFIVLVALMVPMMMLVNYIDGPIQYSEEILLSQDYEIILGMLVIYILARGFNFISGPAFQYPLLACFGLNHREYKDKTILFNTNISGICETPITIYFFAVLFAPLIIHPLLINEGHVYLTLIHLGLIWITCVYHDFLGYVMCRDIYLGKKENQPEKAKETAATPVVVN